MNYENIFIIYYFIYYIYEFYFTNENIALLMKISNNRVMKS